MRVIRPLASITLWLGALVGLLAGGVWIARAAGVVQPLIVISGSMEPGITTGDLLLDRWVPTENVQVGDVVSLPSAMTGKLVTHRVVSIDHLDSERAGELGVELSGSPQWDIRMKGDDNAADDVEAYVVGDRVLTPLVQIPRVGTVVERLMDPSVAIPILVALTALLGLSLLDEPPRTVARRVIRRVSGRSAALDDLDLQLAAVGVDVERFERMTDLDLALFAVGIDVDVLATSERDGHADPIETDVDATQAAVVPFDEPSTETREPVLTG